MHKMVKDKIHSLLQKKGGAISELHTYLDYVKEEATLRRAIGTFFLFVFNTSLLPSMYGGIIEIY